MSHFVSHNAEDFDSLHKQLLQRSAAHESEDDDEDDGGIKDTATPVGGHYLRDARTALSNDSDDADGSARDGGVSARPPSLGHVGADGTPQGHLHRSRPHSPEPRHKITSPTNDRYRRVGEPSVGSSSGLMPSSARKVRGTERKLSDPDELVAIRARATTTSREIDAPPHHLSDKTKSTTHAPLDRAHHAKTSDARARGAGRAAGQSIAVSFESPPARPQRPDSGRAQTHDSPWAEYQLDHSFGVPQNRGKASGMISKEELPPRKLGTWDGVFLPVSLNILGLILFLRFGFVLGQVGLLGALFLLLVSYGIDTLTAMSVSAISTNGQVRGGGAYYLISRSLGPEFGGSIGLVFFLGQALNASMNVLGFVESLTDAFGESRNGFLPDSRSWNFTYGSLVLALSTLICLTGSALFARATVVLAMVLGIAILSIPVSSLLVQPFVDIDRGVNYTGWSLSTLRGNLFPHFTRGAAGSSTGLESENWHTVFGVLFPAVTGILAGASMSGDLRKPSKSIPKGTNWSLVFTFSVYLLSFVIFAATISRESFYLDVGIVGDVSVSPQIVTFGVLASCAFSALMGVMACGKVLQAIARDNLLPVLDVFAQGTELSDTPTYAIFATYLLCQIALLVDSVNLVAQLVTMTSLLTFGTLSFATLALKAGGAPSFRPSFRYFNIWTAGGGALASFTAMFFTDALAATSCLVIAISLFMTISFFCPPKPWGDVTRNLSYHIVRKYLLRLDERKSHVKYWRPQILLLANNPRSDWNLIIFCNSLKKGALYVLGHVLKGEFSDCLGELRRQQMAWLRLVDLTGIKSFVDVIIASDERQGARNLILSCGLGGMRPNIVVMGFPRSVQLAARQKRSSVPSSSASIKSDESQITIRPTGLEPVRQNDPSETPTQTTIDVHTLPTDVGRRETPILPTTYVGIMEDTLALNKALAVAYGFETMSQLSAPSSSGNAFGPETRYLELWPVQIQSPDSDGSHAWDTYTMVLQLGTILSLTGTWKNHELRVNVFVEHAEEVEDERRRVRGLLEHLRVPASLRVFHLSSGAIQSYQTIVHAQGPPSHAVEMALGGDPWWEALKRLRRDDEKRKQAWLKRRTAGKTSGGASSPGPVDRSDDFGPPPPGSKQTRKEQRMLGVSLPAEHLAFFKRNIRIGLAHPRAKVRVDDSELESDWSDSDSDDGSDLSDELARLGFESGEGFGAPLRRSQTISAQPEEAMSSSRNRRSRTYSLGGSAGLPDEPGRSLLAHGRASSAGIPPTDYGSIWDDNQPRQGPARLPTVALQSDSEAEEVDGTLKPNDRARIQASLAKANPAGQSTSSNSSISDAVHTQERYEAPKTTVPHASPKWDGHLPRMTFNSLPNKAQYLILNELIRTNSSEATSVVLTSLPAPEPGTSADEGLTTRYLQQLESLFTGGPPVLGVHAKQLTMTSAL